MKNYELSYIISTEISSEESQAFAKEIESFIQGKEGVIIKSETPVAKTLAFPVKKFGSGFFVISEFQIEPEKIKEINEKLEKDGKILRHIVAVKKHARLQKERRIKKEEPVPQLEIKKTDDKKVELEEIDKKLNEILGE